MALHIPAEGSLQLLSKMLKAALSVDENYIFRLYKNNHTPADGDTSASLTECDFTNYVPFTLTRAGWNAAVTTSGNTAQTSYGSSPLSYTCGTTGNTVFGYYLLGASSGKVLWEELFPSPRILAQNDVLNVTPQFALSSAS